MSNLVELLRREALNGLGCPALYSGAADEIERLRAENATLRQVRDGMIAACANAETVARSMRRRAVAECKNYVGIDKAIKFQLELTADMIAALPLDEEPKP